MHLLLSLLVALLAGFLADYVAGRAGLTDPPKIIVAVLVGVVTFLAVSQSNLL